MDGNGSIQTRNGTGDVSAFLDEHRTRLLCYLDGDLTGIVGASAVLDYVDEVLDEWRKEFGGRVLEPPGEFERTFWFTLYQMETVAEFPRNMQRIPYELDLIDKLREVRELLREREPLPDGHFASRPGEI